MKNLAAVLVMLFSVTLLSACQHTIDGLNKDINRDSDAVNKAISS